jgi:NADPH:quinone reductase-like Zn-dependent oxidoreductase
MEQMMQAIGFRRYGPPEVLEPLEVPVPTLASDTVLIHVAAAGVNPADWRFRSGQFRFAVRLKLPFVPGSDVAGVVVAIGPAVTRFRPGDAVYAMLPTAAGGGYAQYAAVAERNVAYIPPNVSFVEAAAVPLVGLTALQALRDQANLQPGAHLLINGASGGVGSFAVQIAKAMGAQVTAACSGRNADLVRSLGADDVRDYTRDDITTGNTLYNTIFDTVPAHPFRRWRRVLCPGGTLVTVNPLIGKIPPAWLAHIRGGRRIKSLFVQPSGADLETLSTWIAADQIRPVIDQCYPLADAIAAQRRSETKRVRGKLVLLVDEQLAASRAGSVCSTASATSDAVIQRSRDHAGGETV